MRAKDFLIVESYGELFEVNMSPSNLKKLASQTDAKVGIEFEMIVPDVGSVDDEYEQEPDYDYDERTDDIDDIIRFFRDGEYNDRGSVDYLHDKLREEYNQWVAEKANEKWEEDKLEKVYDYIKENYDEEDLADELEIEPDLFGNRVVTKDMIKDLAVKQVEEEGSYYDEARDEYTSEIENDPYGYDLEESVWLEDTGLRYMSDVESRYSDNIMWPHWQGGGGDSEYNLERLAEEFSEVIGRRVHYSTGYHGGPRTNDAYTIEPDSSLSGSGDDAGLEFISPPLPIDEALEDVKKIKDWADERGIYTNRSTGLHMNVSVPGFDPENLDFVKLTLLLGDKYILERFGRSANTYCRSAMDIIEEAPSVQDKELLFKKLKNNLETMASKVIHSGRVGKFTSINPKENRVEFRSPGGDWLDKNFDAIEDTLYRCVVALDAAVDPEKYRKDYLKKLTKMFAPTKGSIEDVFVQYAAGTITREELKFKLKTTQASRKQEKFTAQGIVEVPTFSGARDGDWIVETEHPLTVKIHRIILKRTQQINTDQKAMEAAMQLEPSWFSPENIEDIIVTEYSGPKDFVIVNKDGAEVDHQYANTPLQALGFAFANDPQLKNKRDELTVRVKEPTAEPQQTEQTYKLYTVKASGSHTFNYVAARTDGEARRIALTIFPQMGSDLEIEELEGASTIMINRYREHQQARLEQMNQPSATSDWRERLRGHLSQANAEPAFGGGEGQSQWYDIRNPWTGETISVRTTSEDDARHQAVLNRPAWGSAPMDLEVRARDNGTVAGQAGEGELYIVADTPADGGVRVRATSPEHAIERVRQNYNLGPERELIARLDN